MACAGKIGGTGAGGGEATRFGAVTARALAIERAFRSSTGAGGPFRSWKRPKNPESFARQSLRDRSLDPFRGGGTGMSCWIVAGSTSMSAASLVWGAALARRTGSPVAGPCALRCCGGAEVTAGAALGAGDELSVLGPASASDERSTGAAAVVGFCVDGDVAASARRVVALCAPMRAVAESDVAGRRDASA